MIKLIASDLDGTLLPDDKTIPENLFSLIEKLYADGILFMPASGRQYASMLEMFAPVKDKVMFMAENGALVMYRGKKLHSVSLKSEDIFETLKFVRSDPHLHALLCGEDCAYLEDNEGDFSCQSFRFYKNCKAVNKLEDVVRDDYFCKIAVFDDLGTKNHSAKILPEKIGNLVPVISGDVWFDVSGVTANKGDAIKNIQKYLSVSPDECMAFGDQMNDYGMLRSCSHSFVPSNGAEKMKCDFTDLGVSNNRGAVIIHIEKTIYGG